MAIEEIDWNVAICASTYAELGEAWATLRLINAQLEEPDGGRVLNESGAAGPYRAAHELVAGALRGLDQFLGIQWNYLEGIRRDVHIDLTELKSIRGDQDPIPEEIRAGTAALAGRQPLIHQALAGQRAVPPQLLALPVAKSIRGCLPLRRPQTG